MILSGQDVMGTMKSSSYSPPDEEESINMPSDISHHRPQVQPGQVTHSVMSHANDSSPAY